MTASEWAAWSVAVATAAGAGSFLLFLVAVGCAYIMRAVHLAVAGLTAPPMGGLIAAVWLVVREAFAQARIVAWFVSRKGSSHHWIGANRGGRRGNGGGDRPGVDAKAPVVLVHGIAADGTCMYVLRRALDACGRPTLTPHLGRLFRPLEAYALLLADALDEALTTYPHADGVDIVCHSMGGIALRDCLRVRPDLALRVRRVVTIASPHQGTRAALRLPLVEARQLFPGAVWLDALPSLRRLLPVAPITTIASRHDAIVYPHDTTMVEGSSHHDLDLIGHAELLLHRRVVDLVVAALTC